MKRASVQGWAGSAVALAIVALAGCEGGVFETSHGAVDDGNAALVAGQVDEAVGSYAEAAAEVPESPALNYDRGLAASLAGKHEEATQLLLRALDTREAPLLQKVRAALGVAYGRWAVAIERTAPAQVTPEAGGDDGGEAQDAKAKQAEEALAKWKLAVEHLEEALRMDPNDQASLVNLEVALLRVDPPCSARDDAHERNDSRETATKITVKAEQDPASMQSGGQPQSPEMAKDVLSWTEQLFSCPDNADWYAIDLEDGDRLSGTLTVPEKPGAKLAVEVVAPDGSVLVPALGDGGAATTRFDLSGVPARAGTYYLRVDNVELDESSYGLEVKVRPACSAVEDRFEQNDREAEAPLLTPGPLPDLKLCPGDEDWYAIDLAEGESLFVYAQEQPGQGEEDADAAKAEGEPGEAAAPPFTTEIYGVDGTVLAHGAPTGKGRVSTLLTPGAGRYVVRVVGAPDYEGRYALNVQVVPPCPEGDDRFEDNDVAPDAVDIAQAAAPEQGAGAPGAPPQGGAGGQGPQTLFARVCPGDVDWFKLTEQGDKPAVVTAVFEHAKGDLKLDLFDETGETLVASSDVSSPAQNGEAVALPPRPEPDPNASAGAGAGGDDAPEPPPRTFTIRLSAPPDAENFYLLEVQNPQPSGGGDSQDQKDQDKSDQDKDQGDQDKKDQDQKDQDKQDKDKQDEPKEPQKDAKNEPLQDTLDKLDRNPENLEAEESAKKSPLANHRAGKDW